MHILNFALASMARRIFASSLMLVATTVVVGAGTIVFLWSYWLGNDQANLRAHRTATVFVDTTDTQEAEKTLQQIRAMPGVLEAKPVPMTDFMNYLRVQFPDVAQAMEGMSADAFPSLIEVVVPKEEDDYRRTQVFDQILRISAVGRVDIGARQFQGALGTLNWLGQGGMILAAGLWLVLLIASLGHFQSIQLREAQELKLLRSMGAGEYWIWLPWLLEALLYSVFATAIGMALFWNAQGLIAGFFNQFFVALGYDTFAFTAPIFLNIGIGMFMTAFVAHSLGGFLAILRGKLA